MEWTRDSISCLIERFKNHPVLWDTGLSDYKNKTLRKNAIHNISAQMSVEPDELERKIHTLKVQFSREHCKVLRSKKLDSETNVYVPKWYAYNLLLFLRGTDNSHPGRSSIEVSMPIKQDVKIERSDGRGSLLQKDLMRQVEDLSNVCSSEEKRRQLKRKMNDPCVEEPCKIPKKVFPECILSDEFTSFGHYIGNKLRSFKDPFLQSLAKHEINQVIFNMEMRQYEQQPSTPVSVSTLHSDIQDT